MSEDYGAFCECDYGDDGYSEFMSDPVLRKAKKIHRCSECGTPILPGETYEYACWKFDGEIGDNKTCPTCLRLIDWIKAHVPCFCRMYGELFEDTDRFQEMVLEARQSPGFAFGMLRRVVAIRRRQDSARTAGTK